MLTFYHSPLSRSSTVAIALAEMEITDRVETRIVSVARNDGSGGPDPDNPHPEGKVPVLVHDGVMVWERPAILTYLSDLFPAAPAICPVGHPERGRFLSWLAWYGDVLEPVLLLQAAGFEHPIITGSLRTMTEVTARLETALSDGRPYLLESGFTVVDLLLQSPFAWLPDALPEVESIREWSKRVDERPHVKALRKAEAG